MILIISYIITGVIFGVATNKIIENKGYDDNWFWWGFFFGIIALLVALSKSDNHYANQQYDHIRETSNEIRKQDIIASGGWKCYFCHSLNEYYVTTCSCGKSKEDTERQIKEVALLKQNRQRVKENADNENNTIALLQQYKNLLDSGTITQEEFEQKKQSLLNS